MSRVTRFWHRPRATAVEPTDIVWADNPDGNVPIPVPFSVFKAAVLDGQVDPVELYGGSLQYGSVTWLVGLQFVVSKCGYIIDGISYTSDETVITLDAADATHPRIDVIYVDTGGLAGKITGTPAADPAKPEVDPLTQLELTFITVAALATTPEATNASPLYLEDAGSPSEWDATESTSAARIDLDNTEFPYSGTKCIKLDNMAVDDSFTLIDGVSLDGITIGEMDGLEMHIRNIDWHKKASISVAAFSGANRISAWVQIGNGPYFGFSTNLTGEYQTVNIPKEAFQFTGSQFNRLVVEARGRLAPVGAYIDNIRIQGGGGTTIINQYIGLTEEQLVNNVRQFNVQQPFGADALTDGATITWDLDTDPIATITLDGNRTINAVNIRAGGTYILKVIQDDTTGSRTLTWGSMFEWAGGTAPTLTTTVDGYDMFSFVAFDTAALLGATGGLEFS